MNTEELHKAYKLLKEKQDRHEKILIQSYTDLKQKEAVLKKLNNELCASKEELQTANEELSVVNEELFDKNQIINAQNSELKNTLKQLKDTQMHLLQSEKMASLGVLTAGVAHEINNPLNYMMGAYVGFEKYFSKNGNIENEKIQFLLESLKTGIDKAAAIVKGLGEFSRNSKSNKEDCDLHAILKNCLVMLNSQIKDNINIEQHLFEPGIIVQGNVGKLHQVFMNILTNAIQSITENGVITLSSCIRDNSAVVEIADNGAGIAEEDLPRITDPFFTTKDPGSGTGLGLAICYQILQEHRGSVSYDSVLGKGTIAKIRIPLKIEK